MAAVFLRGKMSSGRELVGYMTSQLVGAVAACLVVYAITGRTFAPASAPAASPVAAAFRFQERPGLQLHAEPSRVPEGRPS